MEPLTITDNDGDQLDLKEYSPGKLMVTCQAFGPDEESDTNQCAQVRLLPTDARKLRDWLSTYLAHQESDRAHE